MDDSRARAGVQQNRAWHRVGSGSRKKGTLEGSLPLGTWWGIPISAAWSVLIIFGLVAGQLGMVALPIWHPEWSAATTWAVALGAAVLFFVSILLHEMSHSVVARARGMKVEGITLFVFGGVSRIEGEAPSPKTEFLVAVVGPLMSLLIAVAGLVGAGLLGANQLANATEETLGEALAALSPGATMLLWLGTMNLVLAAFNMVPGFPLDGGRVLRSILWWMTGSLDKATRWASRVGQGVGFLLIAWGVGVLLQGALLGGVWRILIGWFLNNAAKASYRQMKVNQVLHDVSVARLMQREPPTIEANASVGELVQLALRTEQRAIPVVEGHDLMGLVTLEQVQRLPESQWDATPVRQIMTPATQLPNVREEMPAQEAMQLLSEAEQLPVLKGHELVGVLRRRDVLQWLSLHMPGMAAPPGSGAPPPSSQPRA